MLLCFSFLGGICLFGLSAHLVGGLWGGDGGGAAVDQGGQLVEADDAEEVAQQAGAVGDGSLQAVASAVGGDQPDHQGKTPPSLAWALVAWCS